nr:replication/maintenance protein RepL [uncultured Sulfurimonas sp.]
MSKIIKYEQTETNKVYDNETGKVKTVEEKTISNKKVDTEPNFIKLYISDICKLNNIPKSTNTILNELLKYTSYQNEIYLNVGIKKRMVTALNTTMPTLNNAISKLTKADMLKRIDTGIYKLNPYIFGKGNWTDIKAIRMLWTYNDNGRRLSGIDIDNTNYEEELKDF